MNNIFLMIGVSVFLFMGCGDHTKNNTDAPKPEAIIQTVSISSGETLIAGSDCLGCHHTDQKIVGPSYKEIANKYSSQSGVNEVLVKSIIEGSNGKFGEIPMSPHPTISKKDAAKMVEYILSFK